MANITLKTNPISTIGELPSISSKATDFTLIGKDLKEISLKDFEGQKNSFYKKKDAPKTGLG